MLADIWQSFNIIILYTYFKLVMLKTHMHILKLINEIILNKMTCFEISVCLDILFRITKSIM